MHIFFIWARSKHILRLSNGHITPVLPAYWLPDYTPAYNTPAELWGEHNETEGGAQQTNMKTVFLCQTLHVHHSAQWRSNISTRYLWKTISLFQSTDHLILCCFHPDLRFECLHNKKKKRRWFQPWLGVQSCSPWRIYPHSTFLFSFKNDTMRSACSHLTPE